MHDPLTVAFEVYTPLPWRRWKGSWARIQLVTIWHKDPETDGTDDSCGWFYPHVEPRHQKVINEMVESELSHVFYVCTSSDFAISLRGPGDSLANTISIWRTFHWRLHRKMLSARLLREATLVACQAEDPIFHLFTGDEQCSSRENAERLFGRMMRLYLGVCRPWWRQPRWHVWHWRFQVHLVQQFHRRFTQRCDICHERFKGRSAFGNWEGSKTWCESCQQDTAKPVPANNKLGVSTYEN